MTFQLVCIEPKELTQYKSDMQEAFQKGFEDAFGKTDNGYGQCPIFTKT